jgi:hypothetical protein
MFMLSINFAMLARPVYSGEIRLPGSFVDSAQSVSKA